MEYLIKNKLMSITGGSFIKDKEGNEPYIIKGKFFSIARKKKILDKEGNLLYIIRNKYWNFMKKRAYIYNAEGEKILTLLKKTLKLENRFYAQEYINGNLTIEGKLFRLGYEVIDNEQNIAQIRQKLRLIANEFILPTDTSDRLPFLIALVIAMDNIKDNIRNSSN